LNICRSLLAGLIAFALSSCGGESVDLFDNACPNDEASGDASLEAGGDAGRDGQGSVADAGGLESSGDADANMDAEASVPQDAGSDANADADAEASIPRDADADADADAEASVPRDTGTDADADAEASVPRDAGGDVVVDADADAQVGNVCPPSIPADQCNQGIGWALCIEQPLSVISRPSVIKGWGPALYWYGSNGLRYVFPNETVFRSWFPLGGDCPVVYRVPDADLATVVIGGSVTIKPGSFLVKITTDPKTYAVSCGGVLRWMETEWVVSQIYGSDWKQYVVDVPDSFFVDYAVGYSIADPTDYDPWAELYNVPSPDQDVACRAH